MLQKIKYLIPIIVLLFLVFPFPASADVFGIVNMLEAALEGVEEIAAPLMAGFIKFFLVFVVAFFALAISSLLFGVVINDPNWLTLNNQMVQSGWDFTVGLANMGLVLILIFIAICFILKIETFATKKTLITLFIVALLLNFSLLFTKIIVDVPIFALNTFQAAAGGSPLGLLGQIIAPLLTVMIPTIMIWATALGVLAVAFVVPFTAPFAQLGFVLTFPFLLPILGFLAFIVIAAFLLSGMFFSYVLLFGARVVILSIFAILSPLAFLCLILPQTKKYFDAWLKTVVQWAFLGVILLFFLTLGFKGLQYLVPGLPGNEEEAMQMFFLPTKWWGAIKSFFLYYFFLFIYLLFVFAVSKKTMPTFGEAIISGAGRIGGLIWTRGLKPMGRAYRQETSRLAARQTGTEKAAKAAGRPLTGRERAEKSVSWAIRGTHKLAGTTPELEVEKDVERRAKRYEERFGKNTDAAAEILLSRPSRLVPDEEWAAYDLYAARAEGRKGIERLPEKQQVRAVEALTSVAPQKVKEVVQHRPEFITHSEIGTRVQAAIVPLGLEDPDVLELIKLGVAEAKAIRMAAFKKTMAKMKTEDVTKKTMDDEGFKEAVVRFKGWGFIESLGREKSEYMEALQRKTEEMEKEIGLEALKKINSALINAPDSTVGKTLMRQWSWAKKETKKGKKS